MKDTILSFKIFERIPELEKHNLTPGTIRSDAKQYLQIACSDGLLNITSLQLEGKKRMSAAEFLRGFKISDYTIDIR
jgi:methionyl-tRNA formyltransferase